MKCPHCTVTVHTQNRATGLLEAHNEKTMPVDWEADHTVCPHCKQAIIWLVCKSQKHYSHGAKAPGDLLIRFLSWPRSSERPISQEVPDEIGKDFTEAAQVINISPQASAALTRRCLQSVLREHAKTKSKDLFDQIQEVIDEGHLPPALAEQLDAVRVIGNFAAHPQKSQNTGAILPVEDHEAEWNLDVLESVFDHYFVKPALARERKAALNKKLAEAGKPLLS